MSTHPTQHLPLSLLEILGMVSALLPSRLSMNLSFMISNGTSYRGPGSAAKPLQEESKKDTKEKLTIETPNPSEKVTELPDLYEEPTFMGRPLILKNEKGAAVFNKEVAEALISSVTTTISDVLTFSSSIKTNVDSANPGEQVLEMVDSCFAGTR